MTTASKRHHEKLKGIGAAHVFDYNDTDVVASILGIASKDEGIPLVLDCIGSLNGSITPISKLAKKGSKIAILLPVVVKDSSETDDPIYAMDVEKIDAQFDRAVEIVQGLPKTGPIQTGYEEKLAMYR